MKYLVITLSFFALLFVVYERNHKEFPVADQSVLKHMSRIPQSQISLLAKACYKNWKLLNWKIGNLQTPAANNPSFSTGIKRVCQARSELFFEGYEVSPFIAADSQNEIYSIVFLPTVDEIKSYMKLDLPKLRLI